MRYKPTENEGGTFQLSGVHLRSKPTYNEEGTSESKTQTKEKSGGTSQMQGVHLRSKPTYNEEGTSESNPKLRKKSWVHFKCKGYIWDLNPLILKGVHLNYQGYI